MKRLKILITGASGFIGTNLLQFFLDKRYEVLNIDFNPPQNKAHLKYWSNVDITKYEILEKCILEFGADYVVHLAARTDLDGKIIEDYNANIIGVQNILDSLKKSKKIKRVIFASSQLVCSGRMPMNDNDYNTVNVYGESKKQGELIIKNDHEIPFEWVIVRPTSIWGPWFREPYHRFFNMIINKRYFHFGNKSCSKTYGYIKNIIYQLDTILETPNNKIQGKVFYLGEYEPTNIYNWANEIASELKISIKVIPFSLIKLAAFVGDLLITIGIKFPMTSFRLKNMTTDNIIDLSKTKEIAPNLPYSRIQGIRETLKWLKIK